MFQGTQKLQSYFFMYVKLLETMCENQYFPRFDP